MRAAVLFLGLSGALVLATHHHYDDYALRGAWGPSGAIPPAQPLVGSQVPRIHIIPHSHMDVGWLKTVDECYSGTNNSNQHAAVQYIIDSVVTGLARNSNRTFTHSEQGFFQRWFYEQDEERQQLARHLVARKQLSFVGGGWSQNDEACPHYVTMIDQMTLGHKFLKQEFYQTVKP